MSIIKRKSATLGRSEHEKIAVEKPYTIEEIINGLHQLNVQRKAEALALWKGEKAPLESYSYYEQAKRLLTHETLRQIDRIENHQQRTRLRHALIDHMLQRKLLPHEMEMRAWMHGAAAQINGHKVYLRNLIPWCQKESHQDERKVLVRETDILCKFLKPFALNYWTLLLSSLKEDFGYENYIDYCYHKKGIDYTYHYGQLKEVVKETDDVYFAAMERWVHLRYHQPLSSLNRFDAIHLFGMAHFDSLLNGNILTLVSALFRGWGINIEAIPALKLDLESYQGKSAQAMCFILGIPNDVHILMKPQGGWVDLETLLHEMGHGLSSALTSPSLSLVDREMATTFCLSEAFAFLFQNLGHSIPFLVDHVGLEQSIAEEVSYYGFLKDLSLFRRYAGKFISEYEMFREGDIENGERYGRIMGLYTGFLHQPNSHLLDLVPEFYSLEYVLAWMASPILTGHLHEKMGNRWLRDIKTGHILRKWWSQGNQYDIFGFLKRNGLEMLNPGPLLEGWKHILTGRGPYPG
jgi:hypothetical protein